MKISHTIAQSTGYQSVNIFARVDEASAIDKAFGAGRTFNIKALDLKAGLMRLQPNPDGERGDGINLRAKVNGGSRVLQIASSTAPRMKRSPLFGATPATFECNGEGLTVAWDASNPTPALRRVRPGKSERITGPATAVVAKTGFVPHKLGDEGETFAKAVRTINQLRKKLHAKLTVRSDGNLAASFEVRKTISI